MTTTIGQRIAHIRGDKSQAAFATEIGVHKNSIGNYERGERTPDADFLASLMKAGYSANWVVSGVGPMRLVDSVQDPSAVYQSSSVQTVHSDEYAYIPLYNVEASAGHGSYVETEEVASRLAFRRDWINKEIHANPAHLHLIYVRGDSMDPALESGEVVMVDTSAAYEAIRDGIHVIQMDGSVLIKRLLRLPGNKIKVMSDNQVYPSFESDLKSGDITIIGRVIWHAGRI